MRTGLRARPDTGDDMTTITPRSQPHVESRLDARDDQLAAWKPGIALGGLGAVASFQNSLVPRLKWQQAAVTALAAAAGFGVGTGVTALANKVDRSSGLDQTTSKLAVAGAGIGTALAATVALRHRTSLPLEALRTSSAVAGGTGVLALGVQGEQALADRIGDDVPGGSLALTGAIAGTVALGAGAVLLRRPRASAATPEAAAAFELATRSQTPGTAPFDAPRFAGILQERANMKTVSGGAASLLPRDTLNSYGKRFVDGATPRAEIARTMGVPLDQTTDPVRVYGGLHHATSHDELADKLVAEAQRTGAFDRSHIALYLPSGTGHVNPIPTTALEYLRRGDVASVAMQYGDKPSVQSAQKVPEASRMFETVLDRFAAHIRTLPEESRPTMSAYGESLGAWSMQNALKRRGGSTQIPNQGLTHVLNVGTPGFSPMRAQAIGQAGHKMDDTGTLVEFGMPDELAKLTPAERDKVTAFLFTHYDDPVNKADITSFFRRPEWLGSETSGIGTPATMKWIPGVTGIHNLFDTMNGINSGPGFARRAHDYRDDADEVVNLVHDTKATKQQMTAISSSLEQAALAESPAAQAQLAKVADA